MRLRPTTAIRSWKTTTSEGRSKTVRTEVDGAVLTVTIDRPEVRNAVDPETARALEAAFSDFNANAELSVAVLTGAAGTFCAGFDLKAMATGSRYAVGETGPGPMGPTRMIMSRPVIAAIEGSAVAGGLELALWCDLRVAGRDATLGVFTRRFGVPLIDLGTVRLPRLVGQGRALDLILTGRPVGTEEALRIGLVERGVESGMALAEAQSIAREISAFPQSAMRGDRRSGLGQWPLSLQDATRPGYRAGVEAIAPWESHGGARPGAAARSGPPAHRPRLPGPVARRPAHRSREPRVSRVRLQRPGARPPPPDRRDARPPAAGGPRGLAGEGLLGRHETAPRDRPRHAAPAADPFPRRADAGSRPAAEEEHLDPPQRAAAHEGGAHLHDDPLHGRGRVLRSHRDHRPRQDRGPGHPGRAEGIGRGRRGDHHLHQAGRGRERDH